MSGQVLSSDRGVARSTGFPGRCAQNNLEQEYVDHIEACSSALQAGHAVARVTTVDLAQVERTETDPTRAW